MLFYYFNNKFSKITFFPSILVISSCVIWPNCVFQTNYDKIELLKISYDVISVTSSLFLHRKNVTKLTLRKFYKLGFPIKISGYASENFFSSSWKHIRKRFNVFGDARFWFCTKLIKHAQIWSLFVKICLNFPQNLP